MSHLWFISSPHSPPPGLSILLPEPLSNLSTSFHPHCHFSRPVCHHLLLSLLQQLLSLSPCLTSRHVPLLQPGSACWNLNLIVRLPWFIPHCSWDRNQAPYMGGPAPSLFTTPLHFIPFWKHVMHYHATRPLHMFSLCLQHTLPCYPLYLAYSYFPPRS